MRRPRGVCLHLTLAVAFAQARLERCCDFPCCAMGWGAEPAMSTNDVNAVKTFVLFLLYLIIVNIYE